MTPTRIATFVSVPLVASLAALGHYGARSAWWMMAMNADVDRQTLSIAGSAAALLGAVLGAGCAALAGGAATASAGLLLMAVGEAMVGGGAIVTGAVIAGVGRALVTIGLLSAAVRALAPRAASFRLALLFAAYLATNLGAFGAGFLGSFITQTVGGAATQFVFASITGFALVLSLPLTILSVLSPPEDAAEPSLPSSALPIGFVVAVVGGLGWIAWQGAVDLQWGQFEAVYADYSWIFSINPVVVAAVSLVGVVVTLGVGMSDVQLPPLVVAGVGLLLLAVSLVLSPVALSLGAAGFVALQVIGAIGEPLAFVGLYAAVSTGLTWRISPAAIALLQMGVAIGALVSYALPPVSDLSAWGAAAGGLVVGLLGAGALAAAWPVKRLLEGEETPA